MRIWQPAQASDVVTKAYIDKFSNDVLKPKHDDVITKMAEILTKRIHDDPQEGDYILLKKFSVCYEVLEVRPHGPDGPRVKLRRSRTKDAVGRPELDQPEWYSLNLWQDLCDLAQHASTNSVS